MGTLVLNQAALQETTVMQSFCKTSTSPGATWFMTQVMGEGTLGVDHDCHAKLGDLTITHLNTDGSNIMSHMYLNGFGHGQSIYVVGANPGIWVYIEAVSCQGPDSNTNGFGTQIARFMWTANTTITPFSPGVELFNPHPGSYRNSPSLYGNDTIAVKYMEGDGTQAINVYSLSDFLAHDFTPLASIPKPSLPPTGQGFALMSDRQTISWYTGDHTSGSNPLPGNTLLTTYDGTGVLTQQPILDGQSLSWREPEGVHCMGDGVYHGFASGPSGNRKANVYRL